MASAHGVRTFLAPIRVFYAACREYLLRGGFLLVDDFWGSRQWANFHRAFTEVFPDREIVELPSDHEIFRSYYDIDGWAHTYDPRHPTRIWPIN